MITPHLTVPVSRRGVNDVIILKGFCAGYVGSWLPKFRDNTSSSSLRVKQSKKKYLSLDDETDIVSEHR